MPSHGAQLRQFIRGMVMSSQNDFDFDAWMALAKNDPETFEKQRREVIEQYLDTLPEADTQDRLRRLQWRVDRERERCRTPMESAARLYDMMWESVAKTYDQLQDLAVMLDSSSGNRRRAVAPPAKVLPFKSKNGTTD